MKTIALAFRYLWSRPLAALLNLLLLTLGLASICFVLIVSEQVNRSFDRDLAGIDLVVGAKGSAMQLIFAGIFQIDTPPGNIALPELQELAKNPDVGKLIPMSLADNFRGFRIVGTTPAYLAHYNMRLAQGQAWNRPLEVVMGATAARATGMGLSDKFSGSHGLVPGGPVHNDSQYRVTGILAPCGCVADRLILTPVESVWSVHERKPGAAAGEEEAAVDESKREVTLALIAYKNPQAGATLARFVNSNTRMQAAAPALEVSRLLRLMGVGIEALRGLGAVLLLAAALSVFIALWNAVRERRADLAMLRMLGATPAKVASLLLCEALWLAVLASVLGLAVGHALAEVLGQMLLAERSLPVTGWLWISAEAWIPAAAVGVAALSALAPAISAYRVDVAQLLNSR